MNYSFAEIKKNLKKDFTGLKEIRIAVLSDSSSQLLCQSIKGYAFTQQLNVNIWEAEYNSIRHTIIDEDSGLYEFKPEFVIIFQSSKKLLNGFYSQPFPERATFADEHLQMINNLVDTINNRIACNIIYINFPEINDSVFGNYNNKTNLSFTYQLRKINFELMNLAQRKANFHICDLCALQSVHGSLNMFKPQLYINTDNVLDIDALPYLAKCITDMLLAFSGKFKKCLVLDLDNTLWGGIIGDDGIENIEIGELGIGKAFTEFQKWIKQLKERGIILAVSSKNDEKIAKEPFEKHPDMVLKLEDFAVFAANWENKADNIRYIQSVLNIGYDSMVFFDDNPFERELVKKFIPEITVPDLPEDPADYLPFLYSQNIFETISFTNEDVARTKLYREEADRTILKRSFVNEAEFLKSLEMTALVKQVDKFSLPRAAQLSQRSNQFNLRTVRYTEEQMRAISAANDKFALTISLKDKFGDYGMVGLTILEKMNNSDLFINTWIMSCRVLKRGVEDFMMEQLVNIARENGYTSLIGEYIPTPKNNMVKDHYKNLGFAAQESLFKLSIYDYVPKVTHIKKDSD